LEPRYEKAWQRKHWEKVDGAKQVAPDPNRPETGYKSWSTRSDAKGERRREKGLDDDAGFTYSTKRTVQGQRLYSDVTAQIKDAKSEEDVQEVFNESAMLSLKNRQRIKDNKEYRNVHKEAMKILSMEERPQLWTHFRTATEWQLANRNANDAENRAAPHFFFSKKEWHEVPGMSDDMQELVRRLELPRPSRIQNLSYNDLLTGRDVVIAEQAGSGKTLAYLLPLIKRHIWDPAERGDAALAQPAPKIIVMAPTTDLAQQIQKVADVVSSRSGRPFVSLAFTGGSRACWNRQALAKNTPDLVVMTPGRLAYFLDQDAKNSLDLGRCRAMVFDEVDVLLQDEFLEIPKIRSRASMEMQWAFVTATLDQTTRDELQSFDRLSAPDLQQMPAAPDKAGRAGGGKKAAKKADEKAEVDRSLVWRKGAGLHKVSPLCEHVLVDVTPDNFNILTTEERYETAMRDKALVLVWHLKNGVLKDMKDDRIVVFCNSIKHCQQLEEILDKLNPKSKMYGGDGKQWKVSSLHSSRSREVYLRIMDDFNEEKVMAEDLMKKKILLCTDRFSRGIDWAGRRLNWIVLLDWPRDATEYLRQAGRTARGGMPGGILATTCGKKEFNMAKLVTAAAIRNVRLQSTGEDADIEAFFAKHGALEKFDPNVKNWRSVEARARIFEEDEAGKQRRLHKEAREKVAASKAANVQVEEANQRALEEEEDGVWMPWHDSEPDDEEDGKRGRGDVDPEVDRLREDAIWDEDLLDDDGEILGTAPGVGVVLK